MNREEFTKYIKSLGFEIINGFLYNYKEFRILLYREFYTCYNGSEMIADCIDYNDLSPIEKYLKKELRRIKLKQLLR